MFSIVIEMIFVMRIETQFNNIIFLVGSNEKRNSSTDVYPTRTLAAILDPDKSRAKDTKETEVGRCRLSSRLGMYYSATILKMTRQYIYFICITKDYDPKIVYH